MGWLKTLKLRKCDGGSISGVGKTLGLEKQNQASEKWLMLKKKGMMDRRVPGY